MSAADFNSARESLGDFAGRRRVIDDQDIRWVLARKFDGLSDQNIARMGGIAVADVKMILAEHYPTDLGPPVRRTYDPSGPEMQP